MKYLLLQPLTTHVRSRLLSGQHWLGRAIVGSVLLLLSAGLLLPLSAMAQPTALTSASLIVLGQAISTNQSIASATVRMAAIAVNRLRQDLSQRNNIPVATLKLIETTPTTWNDGCFGLAKPDEICTQARVDGWRVVFANGSQRWTYRTDKQGHTYRLEP